MAEAAKRVARRPSGADSRCTTHRYPRHDPSRSPIVLRRRRAFLMPGESLPMCLRASGNRTDTGPSETYLAGKNVG